MTRTESTERRHHRTKSFDAIATMKRNYKNAPQPATELPSTLSLLPLRSPMEEKHEHTAQPVSDMNAKKEEKTDITVIPKNSRPTRTRGIKLL